MSCCSARTRAGWPDTGARSDLLEDPRAREMLGLEANETPVGLLYLGRPVQEQRVPVRAPLADVVTYLD